MASGQWMIYGANGYTGRLLAAEAVRRGHRPVLAGRNAEKVWPVASRLGLEHVAFDLRDPTAVRKAIESVDLVFLAAGPFLHTAEPMRAACLETGTHYLDITGELPVIEKTLSLDARAKEAGVLLMSAAGFDTVPTDCMAAHVAKKIDEPTELEIGVHALGRTSAGTTKTMVEYLAHGGLVRRGGELVPQEMGAIVKTVQLGGRDVTLSSLPWGDLVTAYRTTGIGDITTYLSMPPRVVSTVRRLGSLTGFAPVKKALQALIGATVKGPGEAMRETARSFVWVRAANEKGDEAEARLETVEGYRLTAEVGVRAVERVFADDLAGTLTPAQALGADFILEIPDTVRTDGRP